MGDFQGHPFRGNQWTDGRTMNVTPKDRGLVLSSRAGGVTGRIDSLREAAAEKLQHTKTKEQWAAEAAQAQKDAEAAHLRVLAAEVDQSMVLARMKRDLAREAALKRETSDACGEAWKQWDAVSRDPVTRFAKQMPDDNDEAGIAKLSPAEREAFDEYRRTQKAAVAASDAYFKAEQGWRARNANSLDDAARRVREAENARSDANRRREVADRAVRNYERDVARAVQTSAEAREPRETPATAFSAVGPETAAALASGKVGYGTLYDNGPIGYYITDAAGKRVEVKPGFAATIKNASEFKRKMGSLFPGANIEGLPRKADPHMLTLVHDEFRALRDEFPEVAVRTIKMNAGGMRATAWSGADKITFGKSGIESFGNAHVSFAAGKQRENPDDTPDFHDGQRSYAAVVRHEFGHQLHFQFPGLLQEFNDEIKKLPARERARVTGYANKNRHEMFAETFAMVKYGDRGTKAHPAVKIMHRLVKDWFKHWRSPEQRQRRGEKP